MSYDWKLIRQLFDKEVIRNVLIGLRSQDKKTYFLVLYLGIDKSTFRCYKNNLSATSY
jgi:hypothetical protein